MALRQACPPAVPSARPIPLFVPVPIAPASSRYARAVATLRFSAVMKLRGINPYVAVSAKRAATLKNGWRKPMPVLVRIDGKPQRPARINMMPAGGGSFFLYLNGNVRVASGTKVGDRVSVELSFDAKYRGGPAHPVPAELRTALRAEPRAGATWRALVPSRKKEIVRYFAALRSEEARRRNVVKLVRALIGTELFLGRTWSGGTRR